MMKALGQHLVLELWGCNDGINDADTVRQAILDAVEAANATLLHLNVHTFSPHGVTGVAVLSESHLSVHSWPEHGYLAADIFTCGETTRPMEALRVLREYFQPTTVEAREIPRGMFPTSDVRPRTRTRRWTRRKLADETTAAEAAFG